MKYRKRSYNSYFALYEQKNDCLLAWRKYFEVNYKGKLPGRKEAKIIEIGSGNGLFVAYLLSERYNDVTGIDYVTKNVEDSKEKYGSQYFLEGDGVEYIRTVDTLFDVVCLFDVIEHFTKDEIIELLDVVRSKLSSNGVVLARMPNGESPFVGADFHSDFTHETLLTRKSVRHLGEICKFTKTEVYPCLDVPRETRRVIRYILMVRYLLRRLGLFLLGKLFYGKGAILTNNINVVFYR